MWDLGTRSVLDNIRMHISKGKLERIPSTESAATMVSARCNQAENNPAWSQKSIICELTKRLSDREAELRTVTREKELLESKSKGSPAELEKAYESLMAHLGEREEVRSLTRKNEHLSNRQRELEKITKELHNTMKYQRALMHEKDNKLTQFRNRLTKQDGGDDDEISKLRSQVNFAMESQRAAVKEKDELEQKLASCEETMEQLASELEQQIVWQNETMEKATKHEAIIAEKETKISKLGSKNIELKTEILRQCVLLEKRDHMLESAQQEITELHSRIEVMQDELLEQKKIIQVFEQRFVTKGQNILDLNAKVENAEKAWAKIEEREKKFTLKECTSNLLREENDNLRLEEKKLRSEINELHEAFDQYKLHFAQDGEKVDMPYFLSKLRETVKLNNRIDELEKLVKEKGYVLDVFQAECDLREKERNVAAGIDALNQIIVMLNAVLNEENVETPRVIGKLEESLLLWTEKTGIALASKASNDKLPTNDAKDRGVALKEPLVDLEIEVGGHDSQDNTADDDENYKIGDDLTMNTDFSNSEYMDDARCGLGVNEKGKKKVLEMLQNMQVGLQSFHSEGMSIAADVNAFFSQEFQEMALKMNPMHEHTDKRDDHEGKPRSESTTRRESMKIKSKRAGDDARMQKRNTRQTKSKSKSNLESSIQKVVM